MSVFMAYGVQNGRGGFVLAFQQRASYAVAGTAMGSVATAFHFFMLFDTGGFYVITAAMSITISIAGGMFALELTFMGELFPVEVRTSAVSIGYQVAAVFAGGLSPFIATGLYAWSGRQWWPIAGYVVIMRLITVVCTHLATKAARKTVPESEPA